ncbi:MAG: geranylgeranylglyceryl/heptaprenylglyceryl phosphate synthase [Bacteroidales bacterium]|nr:geranylgeranylglyceryl/heptaprenylglyceryl phosphate synthase [Bacteroidales bacterium]
MMLSERIFKNNKNSKLIGQLIDPGKQPPKSLNKSIEYANKAKIDFFLVGGSITDKPIDETILRIKEISKIPVILFPGNLLQLSNKADAIFFLSLISGRNPELLIGNHVIAAPFLKKSNIEVIPVGYILIENGKSTSVEYMSFTKPIPGNKPEIAVATAIAGEMLGLKNIYLEAGSGASEPIDCEIIRQVKNSINIPLIVGGGIKTLQNLDAVCKAGADIVIIGSAFEENPGQIADFTKHVHSF